MFSVRLNSFPCPKFIGKIEGDTYRKRIRFDAHLLRNSSSIGICAALLHHPTIRLKWIRVETEHESLVTSKGYLLHHGRAFQYGRYEQQIALPVPLWGLDKARAFEAQQVRRERLEREKRAQGSLFEDAA